MTDLVEKMNNLKLLRDSFSESLFSDPRIQKILSADKKRIVMKDGSLEHLHHQFGYYQALCELIDAMQAREMTVEATSEMLLQESDYCLCSEHAVELAKALAKLGTIRIVDSE